MATQLGILGAMEPVNPDVSNANDWLAHVERLGQSFTAYSIKEDVRVASFLTVIGQKMYRLLKDIISPVKPAELPLDTLIKALTDYLNLKLIIIAKRFQFHLSRPERRRIDRTIPDNPSQVGRDM